MPHTQPSNKAISHYNFHCGGTRKFSVGGIKGAKCISEGAKIQKFVENSCFFVIFSWGGQVGSKCPLMPPLVPPLNFHPPNAYYNASVFCKTAIQNFYLLYADIINQY